MSQAGEFKHGSRTYPSSTAVRVTWTSPDINIHHYELTATEARPSAANEGERVAIAAPPNTSDAVLANLKSGTAYEVNLRACTDPDYTTPLDAPTAQGTTAEEYWVILGTGNSYSPPPRSSPMATSARTPSATDPGPDPNSTAASNSITARSRQPKKAPSSPNRSPAR